MYARATGAAGAVVMAGGVIFAATVAATLVGQAGGIVGRLLAKWLGDNHAQDLQRQLDRGCLLLWVQTRDAKAEDRAVKISEETFVPRGSRAYGVVGGCADLVGSDECVPSMRPFEKEMQRRASSSGSDSNLGLAESFFDGTRLSMFRHVMRDSPWDNPAVIRQTIFSVERLEIHAQSLASAQAIRPHRQKGRPLLDRLADNETSLLLSYQSICGAVAAGAAITPAAEWLIDNFHQVERQIREIPRICLPVIIGNCPNLLTGLSRVTRACSE